MVRSSSCPLGQQLEPGRLEGPRKDPYDHPSSRAERQEGWIGHVGLSSGVRWPCLAEMVAGTGILGQA